jgi:hypothetical protein
MVAHFFKGYASLEVVMWKQKRKRLKICRFRSVSKLFKFW